MSDPDFDVIRRTWRSSGQRDLDGFQRELDPDIVTIPFGAAMKGRSYRGIDAVVGWLRDEIWASWEHFDTVPEEFERVGDKIVVRGHWRATGKESGVELEHPRDMGDRSKEPQDHLLEDLHGARGCPA